MQKMSQTEEMAKMLAGRARRHVLTPEQVSRAMEEQDFDPAGLDELYAALEMRGVQVAEEETELPLLDEEQIGKLEHELSAEGVALDDPVKTYLKGRHALFRYNFLEKFFPEKLFGHNL